jgi:hypothetical protein
LYKNLLPIFFSIFLVSCNSEIKEINIDKNNQESKIQIISENYPPEVFLQTNIKEHPIVRGTYSWNNIEGDSEPPSILTKGKEPLIVSPSTKIKMKFPSDRAPLDIKVYYWVENERGNEIGEMDGFSFSAPKENGEYVYEIVAKWPEGIVHFAAKVKVVE